MPLKQYIRKNIYRWHRITSLLVALPILLWTLSGFLHPVINSFKSNVRNQALPAAVIDTGKIRVTLKEALHRNNITRLHKFRIIHFDGAYYYQIQQSDNDVLIYINCTDGSILKNGDQQYAVSLAQRYLSEPNAKTLERAAHHHGAAADAGTILFPLDLKTFAPTKVLRADLIKNYTQEYKSSNVLLPVYRVQFDRSDKISLYIETSTDRLAAAIDSRKAWFNRFFAAAHSWSFLDATGKIKYLLLGSFSALCFLTSLFGFYVYNLTNKKKKTAGRQTTRKWHRRLGNFFVVTTLLYSFSGAWHTFHKISEQTRLLISDSSQFQTKDLDLSLRGILKALARDEKLTNVSIVTMEGKDYWQLFVTKGKEKVKKYLDTRSLEELADGDTKYGCYLACAFANKPHHLIQHSTCLTAFTHQYSMMNKRLPVIEVGFDDNENYYVETSTGYLSAITNPTDKAERFSFSNFHMHHYWEMWLEKDAGKSAKNILLITSTLGLLILAMSGMLIYFRRQIKKRRAAANATA